MGPISKSVTLKTHGKAYGDKHSTLIGPFISYPEVEVLWICSQVSKFLDEKLTFCKLTKNVDVLVLAQLCEIKHFLTSVTYSCTRIS
jgi:hypothetical protein